MIGEIIPESCIHLCEEPEIKRSSRKCELLDFEIKRSGEHPAVWDLTAPLNTSWPWTSSASLLEAVGGYATHDDFIPLLVTGHVSPL